MRAAPTVVLEADFAACGFGFRPRRGRHDALRVLTDESWRGRRWVDCFSAIPHDRLRAAVQEWVGDQSVLRLLGAMLRAGVMESGVVRHPVTGIPPGGVISPRCATCACAGSTGTGMRARWGAGAVGR